MDTNILVLGLGNILMQDDGVGVRAVEQLLTTYHFPKNVEVLDGGVMGLDLLPYLINIDALLILDAVQHGGAPGAVVRLVGEEIPAALANKMSVHQVGLQEILGLSRLQGTLPTHVVLLGMVPASISPVLALSLQIAAGINGLVEAAVAELRGWGVLLIPQGSVEQK